MEEHKRDRRPKPTSKAKHARKTAPHATDRPVSASCIPLIRGVVNVIACFESKTTEAVHDDLGALMGRPGAHIDNLKSGRVALRDTETAVLAMAGARRGYLTRAWGQKLLQTAHYGDDRALLLDEFWPDEPDTTETPTIIAHNLPAPLYPQFVMRARPLTAVLDALQQRAALVVLMSIGGAGKTSLAREIAERCFAYPGRRSAAPNIQFNAVVWVSDKDRPGHTTLASVLDTITITLGFPSWTRFDHERKRLAVENLLKGRAVLLVIDNFETIADDSLLRWLLRLPEPSKALITTRFYRPELRQGAWLVELDGMSELEARQFIAERTQRYAMPMALASAARDRVIAFAGGNPQVIDIILGIHRDTDQPIGEIVDQLNATPDALFDALIATSWAALREDGRLVLLALALFPASTSDFTLRQVAGIESARFFAAVAQLKNLALIETEHVAIEEENEATVRRALHPLVRQFAAMQLQHNPAQADALRARWLDWAVGYASAFGYLFNDIDKLREIERETLTIAAAIDWALQAGDDQAVVHMAKGIEFSYYVRALWGPKLALHEQYAAAARRLNDADEEIFALAMHVQLLSRQGNTDQAEVPLSRLRQLARMPGIRGESQFHSLHAQGLFALATGGLAAAEAAWRTILERAEALGLPEHMAIGAQHWLATCLARQGNPSAARACYQAVLDLARANGYDRVIARNQIQLALLDLDEALPDAARARLQESSTKTASNDWEQRAWLQRVMGRLHALEAKPMLAAAALRDALGMFERMGLADEIAAVQAELDTLQA